MKRLFSSVSTSSLSSLEVRICRLSNNIVWEVDEGAGRKLLEIGGAFAPFTNGWEWVDGEYNTVLCIVLN